MNCKPGDMAIVVQGTNIGVIVEVISVSHYCGRSYWRVHSAWPTRGWFRPVVREWRNVIESARALASDLAGRHSVARLRFTEGGVIMNAVAGVNC